MTAQLIDGRALAQTLRNQVAQRAAALTAQGHQPGLAVVLVGNDEASSTYVRSKERACEESGLHSVCLHHPATISEADLLAHIHALNSDPTLHGILVQLPLPSHIDTRRVIAAIAPEKDVDGFHALHAGALMLGTPGFRPCTPYGVMKMLEAYDIPVAGADAVVIGRSNIVGKPMALLLLEAHATVTLCHSRTHNLKEHTRRADIVIAAAGQPRMLRGNMIKPGATIIDVGIHRDASGKLCGDVDFESVKEIAGYLSPVPGGVGPMTIAMLLVNTLQAAEQSLKLASR